MIEPVTVPILLDVDLSIEEYGLELDCESEYELQLDQAIIIRRYDADDYDGAYEVTPDIVEQTLNTENKILRRNVTIHEVPMGLATISQVNRLF